MRPLTLMALEDVKNHWIVEQKDFATKMIIVKVGLVLVHHVPIIFHLIVTNR